MRTCVPSLLQQQQQQRRLKTGSMPAPQRGSALELLYAAADAHAARSSDVIGALQLAMLTQTPGDQSGQLPPPGRISISAHSRFKPFACSGCDVSKNFSELWAASSQPAAAALPLLLPRNVGVQCGCVSSCIPVAAGSQWWWWGRGRQHGGMLIAGSLWTAPTWLQIPITHTEHNTC